MKKYYETDNTQPYFGRVYYNSEYDEFIVKFYHNGTLMNEDTFAYISSDRHDKQYKTEALAEAITTCVNQANTYNAKGE